MELSTPLQDGQNHLWEGQEAVEGFPAWLLSEGVQEVGQGAGKLFAGDAREVA